MTPRQTSFDEGSAGPAVEVRNMQRTERIPPGLVERAATTALRLAGMSGRRVSVVLVRDRAMACLNRSFKHRRGPTDVLAFEMEEGNYLGEVIVSVETGRRQAAEAKHPFERELALLVIHGVLHLAGQDHVSGGAEELRMRRLERLALDEVAG